MLASCSSHIETLDDFARKSYLVSIRCECRVQCLRVFGQHQRLAPISKPPRWHALQPRLKRRFADWQYFGAVWRKPEQTFPMSNCFVQRMHLLGAGGHRICDDIWLGSHCGSRSNVPSVSSALTRTAAMRQNSRQPLYKVREHFPSPLAQIRWGKVLKVDDQYVSATSQHRIVRRAVGAGSKQPSAAKVGV
jgi:hypothetical protein